MADQRLRLRTHTRLLHPVEGAVCACTCRHVSCNTLSIQLWQRRAAWQTRLRTRPARAPASYDACWTITVPDVQASELRRRPHIVVATPGRLADVLTHAADLRAAVRRCGVLVLDEADRLLEACFEAPLTTILQVCTLQPMTAA
jgi:hypothetical protein